MAYQWPFMAQIPADAKIRFLEAQPLDLPPPPGFLPERIEHPAHCPFDHEVKPGRIPVKVLAIDGVPKRDTHLFLRPVTLQRIMEVVRAQREREREAPLEPSE